MSLYTLDASSASYKPSEKVNDIISLIWTDRFDEIGDFELVVPLTAKNRQLHFINQRYRRIGSNRGMIAESIEIQDARVDKVLKIKGRSYERIFQERFHIDYNSTATLSTITPTSVPSTLLAAMRSVYSENASGMGLTYTDVSWGDEFSPIVGDLGVGLANIRVRLDADITRTRWDFFKAIGGPYGVAAQIRFKAVGPDAQVPYAWYYAGNDYRTTQTLRSPIVYSADMGNLSNTTELFNYTSYKTAAYVYNPRRSMIVYAPGESNALGYRHRGMMVDVSNEDFTSLTQAERDDYLSSMGKKALYENNQPYAFDGEVLNVSPETGNLGYETGDVVQIRSSTGVLTDVRVAEVTYVLDGEGVKMYPTFRANNVFTSQ